LSAARIAVVTGAAHGIGQATALRLAEDGFDLALIDMDAIGLDVTRAGVHGKGRSAWAWAVDCTDAKALSGAFAEIDRHGPVHVLFNNVGQSARERASEFWRSEPEVWRFVLEVSLVTTMHASRLVVPGMRERKAGRIINMSSDAAFVGDTGLADYAAAKMGVIGFTRALARELAPFQVSVNAVAPGAIRTRAHDRLPPATIDRIRAAVPMGYVAEPADVAHAVSFLASDGARYITGQTLLVDGGRWMV
jgi:NAD(P)-dependent dehydrogenase (short-subunit alcohol dehydrogenase family)